MVIFLSFDETFSYLFSEIVITALRNTDVHLNLAQYPTCPRLIRHLASPGHTLPVHYDSMVSHFLYGELIQFAIVLFICMFIQFFFFPDECLYVNSKSHRNACHQGWQTTSSKSYSCHTIRFRSRMYRALLCCGNGWTSAKKSNFNTKEYGLALLGWTLFIVRPFFSFTRVFMINNERNILATCLQIQPNCYLKCTTVPLNHPAFWVSELWALKNYLLIHHRDKLFPCKAVLMKVIQFLELLL